MDADNNAYGILDANCHGNSLRNTDANTFIYNNGYTDWNALFYSIKNGNGDRKCNTE
jgi:hypothetical protein